MNGGEVEELEPIAINNVYKKMASKMRDADTAGKGGIADIGATRLLNFLIRAHASRARLKGGHDTSWPT